MADGIPSSASRPGCSRRALFRRTALAGLALGLPTFIPGRLFGAEAPSRRIALGMIGCGGQGRTDCTNFLGQSQARVVAVCDADRAKAETLKKKVDQTYGDNACVVYQDFREMLAKAQLDAVGTALPDHWHATAGIMAMRAGCDVYGQKPLTRTIREGRLLADTTRRLGRIYQTGSQQRSEARFRRACELVRNGRLGRIQRIEVAIVVRKRVASEPDYGPPPPATLDWDLWLGPAPARPYSRTLASYNWRWVSDFGGGSLTDWGAHHLDITLWSMGLDRSGPVEVSATAEFPTSGMFDNPTDFTIDYKLPDGTPVRLLPGVDKGHGNGVTWHGEKGTLFVNRGALIATPPGILKEALEPGEVRLPVSNNHYGDFLDAVIARREPIATAEVGHRTVTMALLGEIAYRTGRRIRWNPETESIDGDTDASALLGRSERQPWGV